LSPCRWRCGGLRTRTGETAGPCHLRGSRFNGSRLARGLLSQAVQTTSSAVASYRSNELGMTSRRRGCPMSAFAGEVVGFSVSVFSAFAVGHSRLGTRHGSTNAEESRQREFHHSPDSSPRSSRLLDVVANSTLRLPINLGIRVVGPVSWEIVTETHINSGSEHDCSNPSLQIAIR